MGIQEKEIIELFDEMYRAAQHGQRVKPDLNLVSILTAARVIRQTMEKCCIEICGAIEGSQPDLKLTLHQANAIIDMDNHSYSESLGPETNETLAGWSELLKQAEAITGRKADGSE